MKPDARARLAQIATYPVGWLASAESLKRAADLARAKADRADADLLRLIKERHRRGPLADGAHPVTPEESELLADAGLAVVYALLIGLAIENLAKGILAAREGGAAFEPDGRLRRRTHALAPLVRDCLGALTTAETRALEDLTRSILWRGRYPIPVKPDDLPDLYRKALLPSSLVAAEQLYGRLWRELETELRRIHALPP